MHYQVTVAMTPATVTALVNSGSNLYACRAVAASDQAGRSALWTDVEFSVTTPIGWTDAWTAYTSQTPIQAGRQVTVGASYPTLIGQSLHVSAGGLGQVDTDGQPGVISILNTTSTPFTCGICCAVDGDAASPFCAFPLYGSNLQTIQPLQSLLLNFATQPIAPGTIIDDFYTSALTAFSPSYLIDLTTASERSVSYDINTGWSCGGCAWANSIPAGSDLVPILIQPQDSKADPPE